MCEINQTQVTQIKLLGFRGLYKFKILFFLMFFLAYFVILCGNILIIILVTTTDQLKIPMYFFLKHLAISDVLMTTSVVPMTLDVIVKDEIRVSLISCILQLYFFANCIGFQNFLIAVMSYDRYLAICIPLRYSSLMNYHVFSKLIIGLWVLNIILTSSELFEIFRFNYCGLNYIDHFFCDFGPFVLLSTSDTSALMLQNFVTSFFVFSFPLSFIIVTYIYIFIIVLKISSTQGRKKAFSTCSTHLVMVCAFYGTLIIVYTAPSDESSTGTNKYRSLLYTVASPLINPIIYSLRNHEIKTALRRMLANCKTFVNR